MSNYSTDKYLKYRMYKTSLELPITEVFKMYQFDPCTALKYIEEGRLILATEGDKCPKCGNKALLSKFRGIDICDDCLNVDADPPVLSDYIRKPYTPTYPS